MRCSFLSVSAWGASQRGSENQEEEEDEGTNGTRRKSHAEGEKEKKRSRSREHPHTPANKWFALHQVPTGPGTPKKKEEKIKFLLRDEAEGGFNPPPLQKKNGGNAMADV